MATTHDIDSILQLFEGRDLVSGRNCLYVCAEAKLDRPIIWTHFHPPSLDRENWEWQRTMSAVAYKLWRNYQRTHK